MPVVIGIIIVVIVIAALVYALIQANQIKKYGIEAEATVSRIDIETSEVHNYDTDTYETETTKHYYVTFKNENGETIEASLSNPKFGQKKGDIIKIYDVEEIISSCTYFDSMYDELYYFHINNLYFIKYLKDLNNYKMIKSSNDYEIVVDTLGFENLE